MWYVFMQHNGMCKTKNIDTNQATSIKMKLLICSTNILMETVTVYNSMSYSNCILFQVIAQ